MDGGGLMGRKAMQGVQRRGNNLFTRSLTNQGRRLWDPRHSKLAAYLTLGGKRWPFKPGSRVLYLGAAQGQTISHLSDICKDGALFGVENSLIPYHKLHLMARQRPNLFPLLADARQPRIYRHIIDKVDIVVEDVAAKEQLDIFLDNLDCFCPRGGWGFLMVKPRCIDVASDPKKVIDRVVEGLSGRHTKVDRRSIHRYSKEHV